MQSDCLRHPHLLVYFSLRGHQNIPLIRCGRPFPSLELPGKGKTHHLCLKYMEGYGSLRRRSKYLVMKHSRQIYLKIDEPGFGHDESGRHWTTHKNHQKSLHYHSFLSLQRGLWLLIGKQCPKIP